MVSKFLFWQFLSRQRRQMISLGALRKPRTTELSKSQGFQLRPLKIPFKTNWPSCVCQWTQLQEYSQHPVLPLFFLSPHLTVTHCCHFPARQWHTGVCWALSRVVHWQGLHLCGPTALSHSRLFGAQRSAPAGSWSQLHNREFAFEMWCQAK